MVRLFGWEGVQGDFWDVFLSPSLGEKIGEGEGLI